MSSSADWMQPRKEFEDTSVETSQSEKQRDFFKLKKKGTEYPKTAGQIQRYNIHIIGTPEEAERRNI